MLGEGDIFFTVRDLKSRTNKALLDLQNEAVPDLQSGINKVFFPPNFRMDLPFNNDGYRNPYRIFHR